MNAPKQNYTTLHHGALSKCEKTIDKHINHAKDVVFWLKVIGTARDNPVTKTPLLSQLPKELSNMQALVEPQNEESWKHLNYSSTAELHELKKMRDKLSEGGYLNRTEFMSALNEVIDLYSQREQSLLE